MDDKKEEIEDKKSNDSQNSSNEAAESDGMKILNEVFGKAEISTQSS